MEQPSKNRIKGAVIWTLLAVLLIFIDQIVKVASQAYLPTDGSIPLIKGVIHLTFCKNTGAAFSMFSNYPGILLAVRIILCIAMIFVFIRYGKKLSKSLRFILCLILSGALGNIIDQLFLGYVRDMFEFAFINFAIFNVADIYITVGVAWLLVIICLKKEKSLANL